MASSSTDNNSTDLPASGGGIYNELSSPTSSSKPKRKAMDIRIEELTDHEVHLLTSILSRRPSFGIGRPSKRWLEHQGKLVSCLPSEVKRPSNLLKRFVVKYASNPAVFQLPPAVLCPTHYELHPRLMRRLFVVVLDEVTRHADRLRRWVALTATTTTNAPSTGATGGGEEQPLNPDMAEMFAFVDRVDGLGALWMEPELYLETFHAPPSDRRMVKVESFCEACTLAVLGASARTLADIRAIIIDRAERLQERRERRSKSKEEERLKREKRKEEKREKRRLEWEDEERMLEEVKSDPVKAKERERWCRSGRVADPEREKHQIMLDEIEARHRRHRDRDREPRHQSRSSRHHNSHSPSRGKSHHRHQVESSSRHNRNNEQSRDGGENRQPRLLRIVELWIDHLGPERASIARRMSDDLLVLLRHYRADIGRARPRERPVKRRVHHRRNGIPVAGVAPAAANPQVAAELKKKATDFYRNSGFAKSVYRPDPLAGGNSQVGLGDMRPPPPLCGTPGVEVGVGITRPGAPEPFGGVGGRASGFTTTTANSNRAPSSAFIRRFEREVQVGDGDGDGDGEEAAVASGFNPNSVDEEGEEYYDYYDDDLDEELEEEEEDDDEEEYDGGRGMGYYHAAAAGDGERDIEREERSREKVAAWAVNAWAESHRDLSNAELERGAKSAMEGMHPAFRPSNAAGSSNNPIGTGSGFFPRRGSAVPAPLAVKSSSGSSSSKGKESEREKERERGPRSPLSPGGGGGRRASAIIGSTFGISRSNSNKRRRAEEEETRVRSTEKGKERERRPGEGRVLKEKPQRRGTTDTAWTDATVQSDYRDRRNLAERRRTSRAVPPIPAPSLLAGIDPNQSTEAFPKYEEHLAPAPSSPTSNYDDADPNSDDMQMGETSSQRFQPQPQTQTPAPPLDPGWAPAKKPSRKYCFPDSDIGSVVQRNVDKQYLRKNRGFLNEVPPEVNPFATSSMASSQQYYRGTGLDPGDDGEGNPITPGADGDPWAMYERARQTWDLSGTGTGSQSQVSDHIARGGSSSGGGGSGSRSTAPTSTTATTALPSQSSQRRRRDSRVTAREPTPRVATAQDEMEWRRGWGNLEDDEGQSGQGEDFVVPDDSASNLGWASARNQTRNRNRGDTGQVTQLGDIMRRADERS